MVSNNKLKFTLNEVLSIVENLPTEGKTEIVQRLLSEPSALNVSYLYSSVVELISMMSRAELSDILEAIGERITLEGNTVRK